MFCHPYEASSVHFKDGYLYMVFDDDPHLLRLKPDWRHAEGPPELLVLTGISAGYEGVTYQLSANRWFCLIEAAETKLGDYLQ
jgi:hypothetical protein